MVLTQKHGKLYDVLGKVISKCQFYNYHWVKLLKLYKDHTCVEQVSDFQ